MKTDNSPAKHHDDADNPKNIYILITECLQNDFFLADDKRVCLPRDVVANMLIGTGDDHPVDDVYDNNDDQGRRKFKVFSNGDLLKKGPLYRFFEVVTKDRTSELHIVHIKDWHTPSPEYDAERRSYGTHCEADSWGAKGIDGFDEFLEPWRYSKDSKVSRCAAQTVNGYRDDKNKVTYYEVHSTSLYDFRPPTEVGKAQLRLILEELMGSYPSIVYVVTIGVYSDIRMMTLLTGLREYRGINNLITSDVLTAAPNLERHLTGLDFIDKVLGVEIIHGLNELVSVLHDKPEEKIDPKIIQLNPRFQDYRYYFRDKQTVLAYQDTILAEYIRLIGQRADRVYNRVFWVNNGLLTVGFIFLLLTIIGGIYSFFNPEVSINALVLTGGLGTIQILTSFFLNPLKNLQQNLDKQVRLRNHMETYKTYSTLQALLRHHLTRPQLLEEANYQQDVSALLGHLEAEIKIIQSAATQMMDGFREMSAETDVSTNKSQNDPN